MQSYAIVQITGDWKSQFKAFENKISNVAKGLQAHQMDAQNAAAEEIAENYRNFLRGGVSPPLSPITKILSSKGPGAKGSGEHPALSTLANHVVVIPAHTKGREMTTITFGPALWNEVAFILDRGYGFYPTPQYRAQFFARAKEQGAKQKQFAGPPSPIWLTPPRPHIHVLGDKDAQDLLAHEAETFVGSMIDAPDGIFNPTAQGLSVRSGASTGAPTPPVHVPKAPSARPPGTTVIRRRPKDSPS